VAAGRGRKRTYDERARVQIVATAQRAPDRRGDAFKGRYFKPPPEEARGR
jgi:hypothetical protein